VKTLDCGLHHADRHHEIWPLGHILPDIVTGRVQIQMAILGHLPILTLEGCHTPGAEYNLKSTTPWLNLNIFLKHPFF
jgi:hypothetical protein